MTTQEFLSALETHENKALILFDEHKRINPGYHVTEIKAAAVHTMDCGGKSNEWFETTLQVWAPETADERTYMTVEKFLSIYRRVAKGVPIVGQATVRVEYGDAGSPAVSYLIGEIEIDGGAAIVRLEPPAVACKANNRNLADIPVMSTAPGCCSSGSPSQRLCCT